MSVVLDLLGSTIIGGVIVLMLMNFNAFQSNTAISSDSELQMQQNAKTLAEIINHDFRKIGFNYYNTAFAQADSERISFYSDIDRNGSVDSVTYFLGNASEVASTTTDTIKGPSLGLTKAKFSYLDGVGAETASLADIAYVRAELWIESIEPVDGEYLFTYWEMTINPRNL
jgi:hypothetical protein